MSYLHARTISYGEELEQVGDLYLPQGRAGGCPVVCLLHGGFWRARYGRDHIEPIARDLTERGFVVWNIEYRRVGIPGGGWPGTFDDVTLAIDRLGGIASRDASIDLERIAVVGHSAGGQLALWAGSRRSSGRATAQGSGLKVAAVAGLAAVSDLELAWKLRCGAGAVDAFMGGSPTEHPQRYSVCSPIELLPLGVPQLLIHGTPDEDVPVELSRRYAAAARRAGDAVTFDELPGAQHMDCVDPKSEAHLKLCAWLDDLRRAR